MDRRDGTVLTGKLLPSHCSHLGSQGVQNEFFGPNFSSKSPFSLFQA